MATTRPTDPVTALGKGRVLHDFTLLGAGAAAPTVETGDMGITVTRSGAGVYVVKLPGRGSMVLLDVSVCYIGTAQKRHWISAKDDTLRTLTISLVDVSTAAGAASDLGNGTERLAVQVTVKNTGAGGKR